MSRKLKRALLKKTQALFVKHHTFLYFMTEIICLIVHKIDKKVNNKLNNSLTYNKIIYHISQSSSVDWKNIYKRMAFYKNHFQKSLKTF